MLRNRRQQKRKRPYRTSKYPYKRRRMNIPKSRLLPYNKQDLSSFTRLKSGFPDILNTKLVYEENKYNFEILPLAEVAFKEISCNDPFDPYTFTGGKSALYYTVYSSIYAKCRVYAAKVSVTLNRISDTNQQVILLMTPTPVLTMFTDYDDQASQPQTKKFVMMPDRVANVYNSYNYYVKIHTILQMTSSQYNNIVPGVEYDCSGNSSPSVLARMQISVWKIGETSLVSPINFLQGTVKVTYYCRFYRRRAIGLSGPDVDDTTLDVGEVEKGIINFVL